MSLQTLEQFMLLIILCLLIHFWWLLYISSIGYSIGLYALWCATCQQARRIPQSLVCRYIRGSLMSESCLLSSFADTNMAISGTLICLCMACSLEWESIVLLGAVFSRLPACLVETLDTRSYSRCGRTIMVVNSFGNVDSSRQVNFALTRPTILEALFTAFDTCRWN